MCPARAGHSPAAGAVRPAARVLGTACLPVACRGSVGRFRAGGAVRSPVASRGSVGRVRAVGGVHPPVACPDHAAEVPAAGAVRRWVACRGQDHAVDACPDSAGSGLRLRGAAARLRERRSGSARVARRGPACHLAAGSPANQNRCGVGDSHPGEGLPYPARSVVGLPAPGLVGRCSRQVPPGGWACLRWVAGAGHPPAFVMALQDLGVYSGWWGRSRIRGLPGVERFRPGAFLACPAVRRHSARTNRRVPAVTHRALVDRSRRWIPVEIRPPAAAPRLPGAFPARPLARRVLRNRRSRLPGGGTCLGGRTVPGVLGRTGSRGGRRAGTTSRITGGWAASGPGTA
ncbi:hypothetical protein SAMN05192558_10957 [Actinokineospora alba]|uniref:Uncharacterized protein n=1 Tax=Actinokineospora alba TaxID=504798 RepID=A0A1H0SSP3_9PSEU|nr:hypothetical protein C8E96_2087 [Actinokineospora alba]SDJ38144.1 hypothetical protein SAMN05421871_11489 [Actinokineospora alba]SDP44266.1 hypothetical protein SAMN05192558_10957 [Actinokineospora alba]